MRVMRRMAVVGALAWVTAPGAVRAEPAPALDKRQIAKQYVDAGLAARRGGDYDTAITMYEKAYKLVQHPVLFFDIAQAYRLSGRLEDALRAYKRYLSEVPDGDEAQTAREFVAEIEAKLASQRASHDKDAAVRPRADGSTAGEAEGRAAQPDGAAQGAEHSAGAGSSASTAARGGALEPGGARAGHASAAAAPPHGTNSRSPADVSPGRTLRITGLIVGGVGVAVGSVGIGYLVYSLELKSSQENDPNGGRVNTRGWAWGIPGAALFATGAVLYWRGYKEGQTSDKTVVIPAVSDRGLGFALVGVWP